MDDGAEGAGGAPEWMQVEQYFTTKDRTYAKAYLDEQATYERFHEDCRQGIHACRVQRAACARLDEHLSKILAQVNTVTRENIQKARQERHSVETRLEKLSEQAVAEARGVMAEEKESRKGGRAYAESVTNEICHLYNDLEQAKAYRVQKGEKLQVVVKDKLDEIHVAIAAEKNIREEGTHKLLDLFGEMGTKMQTEIDAVKAERQMSTDRLMNLMETVLPHLEQARQNHVKAVNEQLEDQNAAAALAQNAAEKLQKRRTIMQDRNKTSSQGSNRAQGLGVKALKAALPMIKAARALGVDLERSQSALQPSPSDSEPNSLASPRTPKTM